MTQYAKYISDTEIRYPSAEEFKGVINWQKHDSMLRSKGYVPLINEPEERVGATPVPKKFAFTQQSETRIEPRPVVVEDFDPDTGKKTGEHTEWIDTEITVDTSFITAVEWDWTPIGTPEPLPVRTTCTKYQLVCVLEANHQDMLLRLRNAYNQNEDLRFYWNTVQDLDRTNEDFKLAQQQLGMTDEEVESIFREIQ